MINQEETFGPLNFKFVYPLDGDRVEIIGDVLSGEAPTILTKAKYEILKRLQPNTVFYMVRPAMSIDDD